VRRWKPLAILLLLVSPFMASPSWSEDSANYIPKHALLLHCFHTSSAEDYRDRIEHNVCLGLYQRRLCSDANWTYCPLVQIGAGQEIVRRDSIKTYRKDWIGYVGFQVTLWRRD
jgi:hypothetical protein